MGRRWSWRFGRRSHYGLGQIQIVSRNGSKLNRRFYHFKPKKRRKIWIFEIKVLILHHENPPSLFTMLKSAGRFFIMAHYSKSYSSPSQLTKLLVARGLHIRDMELAQDYIKNIGYYRLSAYLYPLLASPKTEHSFKPGASFDQALDLYRFDRHLRLLMFNEIEKIEIAVRSAIVNITSRETNNPFWMTDTSCFYDYGRFQKSLEHIKIELGKSKEDFIKHFHDVYSDSYPPSWILAEILPLGVLTNIYKNIKSNLIRKKIAKEFSLTVPVFNSWMTIITVARNNCCHHARIWNRTFALQVQTMKSMERPWINIPTNQKKVYFSLCIIKYFLDIYRH